MFEQDYLMLASSSVLVLNSESDSQYSSASISTAAYSPTATHNPFPDMEEDMEKSWLLFLPDNFEYLWNNVVYISLTNQISWYV